MGKEEHAEREPGGEKTAALGCMPGAVEGHDSRKPWDPVASRIHPVKPEEIHVH